MKKHKKRQWISIILAAVVLKGFAVAHYDALIREGFPTNCDAHLAEGIFQTRSKIKTTIHILLFPNMHGCFLVFCICNVKEQKVKSYTPSFLFFTLCCNCS